VFLVGWLAGVVLLWSSSLWTRRDKLIGTLVIPGGLAAGLLGVSLTMAGAVGGRACGSSGPVYLIGKNGSRHIIHPAGPTTCTGGMSTLGTIGVLVALAVLLIAPIASSIYLGR